MLRNQGNVDSYLGESIMAYWGAPSAVPDGPRRACRVALQSMRIEEELRAQDPAGFQAETRTIFAVHAGRALVGNIGSAKQMSYTVIGDNAEIGWKLKRFNHRYGTRIIVSDSVHSAVADQFWFRRLDVIPLYGSFEALAIYELLGERGEPLAADVQDFVSRYERGLAALRAADWEAAQPLFDALLAEYPEDRSVRLMALRCEARDTSLCPRLAGFSAELGDDSSARAL